MSAPPSGPAIDWTHPAWADLREPGEVALARWRAGQPVHAVLQQAAERVTQRAAEPAGDAAVEGAGWPCFVPQADLPAGEPYEAFIARTGAVPTRDNLHDFFNGLVWLRWPRAKRRLNALQAAQIARHGVGPTRGPLRDALTLFDENGAVLDAPPALWQALQARDWPRLFLGQRPLWAQARLRVFGHALLEKLLAGHKAATAHVLLGAGANPSIAGEDAAIADQLEPAHLSPALAAGKPFTPLPLAGIPGWFAGNCDPGFYDDTLVFRPRRAA